MTIAKKAGFLLSFMMFLLSFTQAQTALSPLDSVAVKAITFSELPSSMAQTRIKTNTMLENMVTVEHLSERKLTNDTIADNIEASVSEMVNRPIVDVNTRFINNSQLEINTFKIKIDREVNQMSGYINALDKSDSYLRREMAIWNVTREKLVAEDYSRTMLDRVSEIDDLLNSAHHAITVRTELIFLILEQCSKTSVSLDETLSKLEDYQVGIEDMIAKSKSPSIFNLDYGLDNVSFKNPIKVYIKDAIEDVKTYVSLKEGSLAAVFIVFLILTYFFLSNKKKILVFQGNINNYYQHKLGVLLKSPISAALVLTLAVSSLVLKDRPFAIKSIMLYVSLLPLLLLTRNVIRISLHRYIVAFFLLIFPIIGLSVFPPNNVFYRFILVFLAICENLILAHYYYHNIRHKKMDLKRDKYTKVLVYVLLSFSMISLLSAIFGKIIPAQTLLLTTFYSVYLAAILYNSAVMINGIFITIAESTRARKINAIANYHQIITLKFVRIINIIAVYLWFVYFLRQLKVWAIVSDYVTGLLGYEWQIGVMTINIGNIIIFFLVIYLSTLLSRALQVILEGDVLSKMNLASGLPHSIAVMVKYVLVVLGVVIAASAVGLEFGNFAVIIGALGVGIGFGLQSIFNNLVSGLILLFERPVKIGDTVEIGELIGKVKSIGIRASNIHTIEGAEVIVPNGHLVSNEVINWTLSDQKRRIDIMVGVSYDSDPQQVKSILEEVMTDHPLILQDPKPSVYFLEMGESSLDFRLLFWTASYSEWYKVRSEIVMRTFETLKANGIEIPFPQRDINVKGGKELPI